MTLFSYKLVLTRKPHRCWGCREPLDAGFTTHRTISKDMGSLFSTYWCQRCFEKCQELDPDDTVGEGEFQYD